MSIQCKCYGSNESCRWCFGTGTVYENLTTEYEAQRNWAAKAKDAERERVRLRDVRITALPKHLLDAMGTAIALTAAWLIPKKSERVPEAAWGPFLPWHAGPPSSIPAVTFGVDSPRLDINECHTDRVLRTEVYGSFCGEPIVGMDKLGMEVDRAREAQRLVDSSSGISIPAEILPGEVRCEDGIIRRTTAAETVGYDVYHNQDAIEAGQKRVSMVEAKQASQEGAMVYYRPNRFVGVGEYALIQEVA